MTLNGAADETEQAMTNTLQLQSIAAESVNPQLRTIESDSSGIRPKSDTHDCKLALGTPRCSIQARFPEAKYRFFRCRDLNT